MQCPLPLLSFPRAELYREKVAANPAATGGGFVTPSPDGQPVVGVRVRPSNVISGVYAVVCPVALAAADVAVAVDAGISRIPWVRSAESSLEKVHVRIGRRRCSRAVW